MFAHTQEMASRLEGTIVATRVPLYVLYNLYYNIQLCPTMKLFCDELPV